MCLLRPPSTSLLERLSGSRGRYSQTVPKAGRREPAYHYLLKKEFEEHGARIRALNDRGDESPEGELTDGILDQLAKYERAKIAERSRRGKVRKAREGKIVAGPMPTYGFKYNEARDNYVVDERIMMQVKRIFHMVGVEGGSINGVKLAFGREGVPTPNGAAYWSQGAIRDCIWEDAYKSHTFEEVRELVSPEVASRLDSSRCYGVWWFGRRKTRSRQVSESGPTGVVYRKKQLTVRRQGITQEITSAPHRPDTVLGYYPAGCSSAELAAGE